MKSNKRRRTFLALSASALALAMALPASAQDAAPPAPSTAASDAVLSFGPEFFADYRPNTAQDMVMRIPGFSPSDGSNVRGFEGSVGNVLIGGARPASKNEGALSILARTPAAQVERIDLIRGGAPGIDMQGHPVVVNVILRGGVSREQALQIGVIPWEHGRVMWNGRYDFTVRDGERQYGFQVARTLSMSDSIGYGTLVRRAPDGTVLRSDRVEEDVWGDGWQLRGNWAGPALGGRIDLTGSAWAGNFYVEEIISGALGERVFETRDDSRNYNAAMRYERTLREGVRFEGRLMAQRGEFEGVNSGRVPGTEQLFLYDGTSGETIAQGSLRFERSPTLSYQFGGEIGQTFRETDQSFTLNGVPVPLPSASVRVEELRGEVFGRTTWRPTSQLSVEAGLRLENSTISQSGDATSERDFFYAKPRVQLTWTPAPGNQFRFRVERELGQLNFSDFAASVALSNDDVFGGNIDLVPQKRWIYEGVWERRFWDEGAFTLTLRHDQISDVIDRIPLPGGLSARGNIGDGTQTRLNANLTLPLERLGIDGARLQLNTSFQNSSVTDPTTGESRRISGVQHFRHSVSFTQELPRWNTNWGVEYLPPFGETIFDPDQTTRVEINNYLVLFAEYKPRPDLSLRAQVNIWNDFVVEREVYADRVTRAVSYVERREVDPHTHFQLRLRKTF